MPCVLVNATDAATCMWVCVRARGPKAWWAKRSGGGMRHRGSSNSGTVCHVTGRGLAVSGVEGKTVLAALGAWPCMGCCTNVRIPVSIVRYHQIGTAYDANFLGRARHTLGIGSGTAVTVESRLDCRTCIPYTTRAKRVAARARLCSCAALLPERFPGCHGWCPVLGWMQRS
jgi:hypothetical protein